VGKTTKLNIQALRNYAAREPHPEHPTFQPNV
jgi:hypothetical protein